MTRYDVRAEETLHDLTLRRWDRVSPADIEHLASLVRGGAGENSATATDPGLALADVLAAIEAEPEVPGEMPSDLVAYTTRHPEEAMRLAVRETKRGIERRVRSLASRVIPGGGR